MQPTGRNATSGVACTHATKRWSGFSLTTRPGSSSYPPSFALDCTPQVNLAGVLRWSGNRRGVRRATGAAPARASCARRLSHELICADFRRPAIKASKKSAITQLTKLQRQGLRFCAISLLIVNTRSNQNGCRGRPIDRSVRASCFIRCTFLHSIALISKISRSSHSRF